MVNFLLTATVNTDIVCMFAIARIPCWIALSEIMFESIAIKIR